MMPTVSGVALLIASLALAFGAGRWTGRNAFLYSLETDLYARRELLERLAKLENMRLVGRE